jgi:hypothetical protein
MVCGQNNKFQSIEMREECWSASCGARPIEVGASLSILLRIGSRPANAKGNANAKFDAVHTDGQDISFDNL